MRFFPRYHRFGSRIVLMIFMHGSTRMVRNTVISLPASHRDPFKRNYAYHYPYPLDVEAMREAISYLVGTHDFTSFCSAKTEVVDKVRTIHEIDFEDERLLMFRFVGNGFLYNMVRILVGTLLEVGSGKRNS